MAKIFSFYESGERYQSLRIVSAFFVLIGAALLAIGALGLVFAVYTLLAVQPGGPPQETGPFAARPVSGMFQGVDMRVMLSLIWSVAFLLAGLQQIAMGAVCRLLIHLEENTRATAQLLDKVRAKLESSGEGIERLFRS
jgi:hypothetical protein